MRSLVFLVFLVILDGFAMLIGRDLWVLWFFWLFSIVLLYSTREGLQGLLKHDTFICSLLSVLAVVSYVLPEAIIMGSPSTPVVIML